MCINYSISEFFFVIFYAFSDAFKCFLCMMLLLMSNNHKVMAKKVSTDFVKSDSYIIKSCF